MLRTWVVLLAVMVLIGSLMGRMPAVVRTTAASADTTRVAVPTVALPAQQVSELDRSIELRRDSNGYFYADVKVNGAPIHMLVDTGATDIALSRADARMAGVATSIGMNDVIGQGADGAIKGESVTLDRVSLGEKEVEKLPAMVLDSGSQSLLGQSFLARFASVKIEGDRMILR